MPNRNQILKLDINIDMKENSIYNFEPESRSIIDDEYCAQRIDLGIHTNNP